MHNKYFLLLALAGSLWGFQPVTVKLVVAEMDPSTLIPIRYFLSGLTLFAIMKLKGETKFLPPKECLFGLAMMGLFGVTINNGAQFSGLRYSTVANATLIGAATPAITAFLAAIFIRERLLILQWIGIFISLAGTLYLISGGSLAVILNTSFNFGDILFFIAQVGWAICCLISTKMMKKMSVLSVTAWFGLIGSVFTAIYGEMTVGLDVPQLSWTAAASFLFIVWGGGVAAMMCWNTGVHHVGASTASIFLNFMPIVGIVSAAFTLGEVISLNEVFGAVVIIIGVYITTHGPQINKRLFHR